MKQVRNRYSVQKCIATLKLEWLGSFILSDKHRPIQTQFFLHFLHHNQRKVRRPYTINLLYDRKDI